MQKLTLRRLSLLLAAILASGQLAACGESGTGDDTQPSGETTAPVEEGGYKFSKEYEGDTIRVLNINDIFSMHCKIDTLESNGDMLNDTMFNAVRKLEDEMGVIWKETNVDLQTEFLTLVPQIILAGDDQYEIIYENTRDLYTFAGEGYYYNLLDYDGIQLDEPWWISAYNDFNMVNEKLYTGMGYSHLAVVDAIAILNFNQSMMEKLSLDLPYDLVREGKWTLDQLKKYCQAAANLNGDEAFKWTEGGKCIWGISVPNNTGTGWLRPFGEQMVDMGDDGKLEFTAKSERFYNAADKVASFLGLTDGSVGMFHYGGDDKPDSYIGVFENQRSLFGSSEIAKANRMRDAEYEFGVLPYPKYDESQERYYASISYPASGVSIPVTCQDPERSAVVGDAINYIFYTDVWPVFREVTLESKNMRNDDSIEMLGIILESIYPNMCHIYGVGTELNNALSANLRKGDAQAASTVASHEQGILDSIDKINNR